MGIKNGNKTIRERFWKGRRRKRKSKKVINLRKYDKKQIWREGWMKIKSKKGIT